MSINELYQKPGHLIRRANQISTAIFAEECGTLDLTAVQYAALKAISTHTALDATRLSSLIAIDRATVGGVVERLEAKGWIGRKPSDQDRRVKFLHITKLGIALLQEAEVNVARVQTRLLAPLSPDERQQFMQILTKLVALGHEASRAPQANQTPKP